MITYLSNPKTRSSTIKRDFAANDEPAAKAELIGKALRGENNALTNTSYEVVSTFLPQLVHTNPDLEVETSVPGTPQYEGMGLGMALEALCEQQDWTMDWMQATADMLVWEGVIMVSTDDSAAPRYTQGREIMTWSGEKMKIAKGQKVETPKMTYIDRHDFFIDHAVKRLTDARHMGHRWQEDHQILVARAEESPKKWKLNDIRDLKPNKDGLVDLIQMFVPGVLDDRAVEDHTERAANDPEHEYEDAKDSDFHTGTIYTFAGKHGHKEIRPPRLFRGPVCGPYVRFEGIPMPFSKAGAAHLAMTYTQIDNAARIESAALNNIEDYEAAIFVSKALGDAFESGEHNGLYQVSTEAIKEQLATFTKGGLTSENLQGVEMASRARDRTVGMSESMSGNASSNTTATAETLADQSTGIRMSLLQAMAYRKVEKCLYVAGWYIEHSPSFVTPLKGEAVGKSFEMMRDAGVDIPKDAEAATMMGDVPMYTGGDALKDDPAMAYDAKTIKIVAMSMERTTEGVQQRRAIQFVELVGQLVEMKAKFPTLDIQYIADQIGPKMNMPNLGKALPGDEQPMEGQQGAVGPGPREQTGVPGNEAGNLARV